MLPLNRSLIQCAGAELFVENLGEVHKANECTAPGCAVAAINSPNDNADYDLFRLYLLISNILQVLCHGQNMLADSYRFSTASVQQESVFSKVTRRHVIFVMLSQIKLSSRLCLDSWYIKVDQLACSDFKISCYIKCC
jgi:hypothetical protein